MAHAMVLFLFFLLMQNELSVSSFLVKPSKKRGDTLTVHVCVISVNADMIVLSILTILI